MEAVSPAATNETLRGSPAILPLATKLLKETETMDPYKKYILGQPKYRSRGFSRRDEKKRPARSRKSNLQELDETVASVERSHRSSSSRRSTRADELSSVGSGTIATREGNSIYEHRNLIDNLQTMKVGSASGVKESKSSYSKRSRQSRSSRRKNRKSLERFVADTLLDSTSWGGSHFVTVDEAESSKKPSTELILQDLDQASAVIESEIMSTRSKRSSFSRKKRDTSRTFQDQSPFCCLAENDMFVNFDDVEEEMKNAILNTSIDVSVLGKSHRPTSITTPETSASSSYGTEPVKRISVTQILQDNSWPDVFEGLEQDKASPAWTTTASSSHSKEADPYNSDAFVTQEWTTFENPFFANSSSDPEHNSTESPSSIVHCGSGKKKNCSKTSLQREDTVSTKFSI